ncbi:MAG: sel1 repeat family protein [Acidobacteriota bacterium]|nr:sel1 repeat family protein [Acidobacteriota bacterium]
MITRRALSFLLLPACSLCAQTPANTPPVLAEPPGEADYQKAYGLYRLQSVAHPGDPTAAFKPCMKAAKAGHPLAMVLLGNFYQWGDGVREDEDESRRWNQKALPGVKILAESGRTDAQAHYAFLLSSALGIAPDLSAALVWYRKAADGGEISAWGSLGGFYERGKGTPKDIAEARHCYEEGARRGDPGSLWSLGRLDLMGGPGTPANPEKACQNFTAAAGMGLGVAALQIGDQYIQGVGVPKDLIEAGKWLYIAERLGDGAARIIFAMEISGKIPTADEKEAVRRAKEWLRAKGRAD